MEQGVWNGHICEGWLLAVDPVQINGYLWVSWCFGSNKWTNQKARMARI